MNKHKSGRMLAIVACVAVLGGLAGCTGKTVVTDGPNNYAAFMEAPVASNFQTSLQPKLQAAEHWRRAANDSADALATALRNGAACIAKTGCKTLYVKRSCETSGCSPTACETTFSRVFFNEFLTALVHQGYQVAAQPVADAITLEIDAQALSFATNRPQFRYAGKAVELGDGVWALKEVVQVADRNGNPLQPESGGALNWLRTNFASGATPRNELVLSVSALSPDKTYLARSTSIYYTADVDASLYFCAGAKDADPGQKGARTWNIPVTGDCSTPRCTSCVSGSCVAPLPSNR